MTRNERSFLPRIAMSLMMPIRLECTVREHQEMETLCFDRDIKDGSLSIFTYFYNVSFSLISQHFPFAHDEVIVFALRLNSTAN